MSWIEILLVNAGLLLDLFAAVECQGALVAKVNKKHLTLIWFLVGAWQLVELYVGFFLSNLLRKRELETGHDVLLGQLIAVVIFFSLGLRLMIKAVKNEPVQEHREESLGYRRFVKILLTTSIYTILIGVAFGFLGTDVAAILVTIVVISVIYIILGMYIGYHFGAEPKRKAYFLGAVLLWIAGVDVIVRYIMNII